MGWRDGGLHVAYGLACEQALGGGGIGKGKRACSYISGIWYLHRKFDVICWLAEMTFLMFVYIVLVSTSHWLVQLSWWRATGELEVEFKFQRHSCKLFFVYPPRCQNAPESLLAGQPGVRLYIQGLGERIGEKVWACFAGCFHFTLYPIGRLNTEWGGGGRGRGVDKLY